MIKVRDMNNKIQVNQNTAKITEVIIHKGRLHSSNTIIA